MITDNKNRILCVKLSNGNRHYLSSAVVKNSAWMRQNGWRVVEDAEVQSEKKEYKQPEENFQPDTSEDLNTFTGKQAKPKNKGGRPKKVKPETINA